MPARFLQVRWVAFGVVLALMMACASPPEPTEQLSIAVAQREDRDTEIGRTVPSLIYTRADWDTPRPLAILSHGYGAAPQDYGFLAEHLVRQGYVVASIDHEVPGDPPLPSTGDVLRDRTPSWRSSVRSIRFVRDRLVGDRIARPGPVMLVGHSHGGDASMLMASDYPEEVGAVFSLDNRRQPMPRSEAIRICSIRSSDQSADPGVMPEPTEIARFGIRIVQDPDLRHDDMSDAATAQQKARILAALDRCLGRA